VNGEIAGEQRAASAEPVSTAAPATQMAICVSPTAPTPSSLPCQQIVRAGHGQHDLEDARALLFDDRAGHIHAVEQMGMVSRKAMIDAFVTMRIPLLLAALPSLSTWRVSMETCLSMASASAWLHAAGGQALIQHAAIQGILQLPWRMKSPRTGEV
jgi:hypothetical protein